jgi:hypothetical protein
VLFPGFGQRFVDRAAARWQQAAEQRLLIEHMHERISQRGRAVGEFIFVQHPHQAMHALQRLQSLFDIGRIELCCFGNDGRVELMSLGCRDGQQPMIVFVQALQFSLNHAPHGLGQVVPDLRKFAGELPTSVRLSNHTSFAQVAQQIRCKQRASFRPRMNQLGEVRRKRMIRKRERKQIFDLRPAEETKGQFVAHALRLQVELDAMKRMRAKEELRRPISHNDQHGPFAAMPADISEQIDGRDIGPMNIVDKQDDGADPRNRGKQIRNFMQHGLLRVCDRRHCSIAAAGDQLG